MKKLLQVMMITYATGSCIGYQIFIGQLLSYICEHIWTGNDKFFESMEFRLCANVPVACLILLPLALKRDMSSLAFMGLVSVASLFYVLIVMLVEMPFYYQVYVDDPKTEIHAFKLDMNVLTSCSIVFFAYTCQMALLPIYSELVNPNYRRIKKVITRSLTVDLIFFVLMACAGYFS